MKADIDNAMLIQIYGIDNAADCALRQEQQENILKNKRRSFGKWNCL